MTDDADSIRREEKVYAALWKPRLWFGCHPMLLVGVGFAALMLVPVALLTHNVSWMLLGVIALAIAVPLLRKLALYEPDIVEVLPRYRDYARHYSAIGSVGSRLPAPRRHQR